MFVGSILPKQPEVGIFSKVVMESVNEDIILKHAGA